MERVKKTPMCAQLNHDLTNINIVYSVSVNRFSEGSCIILRITVPEIFQRFQEIRIND